MSRPTLGGNVIRSLAGQIAPGLAAVVALPALLGGLGADGLGILHMTWAVVGYFSLLDVGIGRALTQAVAAAVARDDLASLGGLVFTGCATLLGVGLLGALVFGLAAEWVAASLFGVTGVLREDAVAAFRFVALAVPLVTVSSGARGVLEAQQRFDLVNRVRIPMGVLLYAAPAAALPLSHSVATSAGVAVAMRAAGALAMLWLVWRHTPVRAGTWAWSRHALQSLMRSGAWMAAANLIGTVTQFADRIALGALVSMSAVAYYSTPLDVISRLGIVAAGLTAVMFPAFSAAHATGAARLAPLALKAAAYTMLSVFPPVLVIVALAPELLTWWLGPEFAASSAVAARLIAVGTLANALAQTPFALLQAMGRARVTARIAALELPAYAVLLWIATRAWGVEGVAAAWAARMTVDAVAHFALAWTGFTGGTTPVRAFTWSCLAAAATLTAAALAPTLATRLLVAGIGTALCAVPMSRVLDAGDVLRQARSLVSRRP
ncbi:MAG: oligosaccharide flippase family protein [Vicinamibacterales bacterium]